MTERPSLKRTKHCFGFQFTWTIDVNRVSLEWKLKVNSHNVFLFPLQLVYKLEKGVLAIHSIFWWAFLAPCLIQCPFHTLSSQLLGCPPPSYIMPVPREAESQKLEKQYLFNNEKLHRAGCSSSGFLAQGHLTLTGHANHSRNWATCRLWQNVNAAQVPTGRTASWESVTAPTLTQKGVAPPGGHWPQF